MVDEKGKAAHDKETSRYRLKTRHPLEIIQRIITPLKAHNRYLAREHVGPTRVRRDIEVRVHLSPVKPHLSPLMGTRDRRAGSEAECGDGEEECRGSEHGARMGLGMMD